MENTEDIAADSRGMQSGHKWMKRMGSRRQVAVRLAFALLYTLFYLLGNPDYWKTLFAKSAIQLCLSVVGVWVVCFVILTGVFALLDYRPDMRKSEKRHAGWKGFLLFAVLCLLCYLPYFWLNYPGWVSNDTVWQLEQICGMKEYSNHHPFFHTMLIKVCFECGRALTGTVTGGVAAFVLVQMVFMSCVYARILCDLYEWQVPTVFVVLALLFYALLPVNGIYAIGLGKDTVFAGVLLLYARYVCLYAQDHKYRRGLTALGLLVCLLRSNGILIYAGTALGMVISGIRHRQGAGILKSTGAVLVCYLLYQGVLLNALQVTQPDTVEGLTMPLQQILCAYQNDGEFTQDQTAFLSEIVPLENLEEYYNPSFFDLVKNYIREEGNQEYIAEHKAEFIRLWVQIGLQNPLQYLEAEVRQTYGYWGFRVETPLYEQYRMAENPFGLTVQRKVFSYDFGLRAEAFLQGFQDAYNKVWSLGLTTWLMLGCMAYAMHCRKSVLPYLPFVMLLVSLLLATPVYAEFRYTYGMFVALPLLLCEGLRREDRRMVEVEHEKVV